MQKEIAFECMVEHLLADIFVNFSLRCEIGVGRLKNNNRNVIYLSTYRFNWK